MALSRPTIKLFHCRKDSALIRDVLKCAGLRSGPPVEGELVILYYKKPLSPKRKSASRKTSRRKKTTR
jgi:hypothetical protein